MLQENLFTKRIFKETTLQKFKDFFQQLSSFIVLFSFGMRQFWTFARLTKYGQ